MSPALLLFLWCVAGFWLGVVGLQLAAGAVKGNACWETQVVAGCIGALLAYTVLGHHLR